MGLPSHLVGLPSCVVGQNHGSSWSGFTQWMQHVQKHFINQLFLPGVIPSHAWSIYSPAQVPNHAVPGTLGCQQALLWRFFPAQGCPPCCGAGLEHCRLRRDVPAWHGDQPDQQLQRPSVSPPGDTQKRKGKTNEKKGFQVRLKPLWIWTPCSIPAVPRLFRSRHFEARADETSSPQTPTVVSFPSQLI